MELRLNTIQNRANYISLQCAVGPVTVLGSSKLPSSECFCIYFYPPFFSNFICLMRKIRLTICKVAIGDGRIVYFTPRQWDLRVCCGCVLFGTHTASLLAQAGSPVGDSCTLVHAAASIFILPWSVGTSGYAAGVFCLGAHTAELISSGWQSRWGLMCVSTCRRLYLYIALVRWDFRVCCGCVLLGAHTAELISSGWQSRWGLMYVGACRRLYLHIALVRWDFRVCCGCVPLGTHTAELISSGWQSRWGLMCY
jgi:hypothetical protein